MLEHRISKKLLTSLHCPACAGTLSTRPVLDPFLLGLECPKGHRYTQVLKEPEQADFKAVRKARPKYPRGADLAAKAHHWLTEPVCRRQLFTFVAVIVRRAYEVRVLGEKAHEAPESRRCPVCGDKLDREFDRDFGGWSAGLMCKREHRFYLDSSSCRAPDLKLVLLREPGLGVIKTYADVYSSKSQGLPDDLQDFLRAF